MTFVEIGRGRGHHSSIVAPYQVTAEREERTPLTRSCGGRVCNTLLRLLELGDKLSTPLAAVPGSWIDLTQEGFCYAENLGLLSFSKVAQSLVH